MMTTPRKPKRRSPALPPRREAKAGPGQLVHDDPQQCWSAVFLPGPHVHDLCKCDADVDDGNVRYHIKHVLDGHWPLTAGQEVVICPLCGGAMKKTSTHKAALNYEPLARR